MPEERRINKGTGHLGFGFGSAGPNDLTLDQFQLRDPYPEWGKLQCQGHGRPKPWAHCQEGRSQKIQGLNSPLDG